MRAIPFEIRDAVELWARQHGRHLHSFERDGVGVPVIELDLNPNDPRLEPWQQGKLRLKPVDTVMLMYQPTFIDANGTKQKSPHFEPLDTEELGITGVLEILDRGNLASGRGDFRDVMDAVQQVAEHNEKLKQSIHKEARQNARYHARELLWDAQPKVAVAADLKS